MVRMLLRSPSRPSARLAVFLDISTVTSELQHPELRQGRVYSPTANQSGQTIRHLRLRFNDNASHTGTLEADGG
jgi:hypothetical protein